MNHDAPDLPPGEGVSPAETEPLPPLDPSRLRRDLHIPAVTFIKISVWILVAIALYLLRDLILMLAVACLVATTLNAAVQWMEKKGIGRHWALSIIVITGVGLFGLLIAFMAPTVLSEAQSFWRNLPSTQAKILERLQAQPYLQKAASQLFSNTLSPDAAKWAGDLLTMGGKAAASISEIGLTLIFAVYLVVDGGKIWKWILAFFPPPTRRKLHQTGSEVSDIIWGYVAGQGTMSLLVTIYSFIVLKSFHVPAAILLSCVAGFFDIMPILGFLIFAGVAFLVAFSVSVVAAFSVLGLYLAYHLLEAYVIMPKVYGKNLRLSTLTVLLALLAGTILAGVAGAVIALPLVASYSVVESIWLTPWLGETVPEKHQDLEEQEFGKK